MNIDVSEPKVRSPFDGAIPVVQSRDKAFSPSAKGNGTPTPASEIKEPGLPELDHSELDHSELDVSELDVSELDHSELDHSELDVSELDHSELDVSELDVSELSGIETDITRPNRSSQ